MLRFPYHTDPVTGVRQGTAAQRFYDVAYAPAPNAPAAIPDREAAAKEEIYLRIATDVAEKLGVKPVMAGFVNQYGLADKRVLDVGSGQGYLQDLVADYTGLDISGTVRRFYHKPFVQASATEMPFHDDQYDAIWSIWVMEHVPNPEQMLSEMRRVVKPGGLIYLHPAWYCTPWAAEGYAVRPYRDFGFRGKLIKAALPLVASPMLDVLERHPTRFLRWAGSKLPPGPTRFHYRLLRPNYDQYWMADSDALNSMDPYEAYLWFTTRGDQCLNCGSGWRTFWRTEPGLVIRVHKAGRRES